MKNFASRIAVFASATVVGLSLVSTVAITPAEARTSVSIELSNRPYAYGYGPDYRRPGWDRGWDRPYRYQPACWTEWHYNRWDGRYPVRVCR